MTRFTITRVSDGELVAGPITLDPNAPLTMPNHDIEIDWPHGHLRLTCRSCHATGGTCLRQPYMTDVQWQAAVDAFRARHPSEKLDKITGESR